MSILTLARKIKDKIEGLMASIPYMTQINPPYHHTSPSSFLSFIPSDLSHIPLNSRNHLIPHPRRILKHALEITLNALKPLLIQTENSTFDAFCPPAGSNGEFEVFFAEGEVGDGGVDDLVEEGRGVEEVFCHAEPEAEELEKLVERQFCNSEDIDNLEENDDFERIDKSEGINHSGRSHTLVRVDNFVSADSSNRNQILQSLLCCQQICQGSDLAQISLIRS